MADNRTPVYNLKVVLQQTGIAADTLRAWERRYGLPMPQRSAGGHRLYSERDIETIKWLMRQQKRGLSISRAVEHWKEESASGRDPLGESDLAPVASSDEGTVRAVRAAWVEACLQFDETAAEKALTSAFALYPVETVCTDVLQRGLSEVGDQWYCNAASVQQEHFASALAHRRLDSLIAATPPPTRNETILIGCTSGERHVFSALLITLLLRRRGLPVVYLGADVPEAQLKETVRQIRPALVILIAQQLSTAGHLRAAAAALARSESAVSYGGRIFNLAPDLRSVVPAHFLGETISAALPKIESLLGGQAPEQPAVQTPDPKFGDLAERFHRSRPAIDMNVLSDAGKAGVAGRHIDGAVQFLGDILASVISLGRPEALQVELDWVQGMLSAQNLDPSSIDVFMHAYARSVETSMGEAGREISRWLVLPSEN